MANHSPQGIMITGAAGFQGRRLQRPRLEALHLHQLRRSLSLLFPGHPVTEKTPPYGRHIHAVTRRKGEAMLGEYAGVFPSCIVRFAALFSDSSEYSSPFVFLENWLSGRWNSRLLAGRGESVIPHLQVRDAESFIGRGTR